MDADLPHRAAFCSESVFQFLPALLFPRSARLGSQGSSECEHSGRVGGKIFAAAAADRREALVLIFHRGSEEARWGGGGCKMSDLLRPLRS